MSSSDALLGVMGDLKRRLRAPASPEVVHARRVARQVLVASGRDVSESGEPLRFDDLRDAVERAKPKCELTVGLPTPPKTLALVRPETCTLMDVDEHVAAAAEVDALCPAHADVDQIALWEMPSRPPVDAPLRTLIAYLVRRWWRRLWR